MASAETIDEMRSDTRCWLMALAWPLRCPFTRISAMALPLSDSAMTGETMPVSVTLTTSVTGCAPR